MTKKMDLQLQLADLEDEKQNTKRELCSIQKDTDRTEVEIQKLTRELHAESKTNAKLEKQVSECAATIARCKEGKRTFIKEYNDLINDLQYGLQSALSACQKNRTTSLSAEIVYKDLYLGIVPEGDLELLNLFKRRSQLDPILKSQHSLSSTGQGLSSTTGTEYFCPRATTHSSSLQNRRSVSASENNFLPKMRSLGGGGREKKVIRSNNKQIKLTKNSIDKLRAQDRRRETFVDNNYSVPISYGPHQLRTNAELSSDESDNSDIVKTRDKDACRSGSILDQKDIQRIRRARGISSAERKLL